MIRHCAWLLLLPLLLPLAAGAETMAQPADDRAALVGITSGKAVFDIRIGDAKQLLFALQVIDETAAGLGQHGVATDFILTFRGATLPLLKRRADAETPAQKAILSEIHERLTAFRARQMPLEACGVAARVFKIESGELDPSVTLIGNSLVSLIAYQQRGYALVPMY